MLCATLAASLPVLSSEQPAGADTNVAPSTPVLISPAPGEQLGPFELQLFVVRAADANGDLYKATITLRTSTGAVIGTYDTPFTTSDANASVPPAPRLAAGSYRWSAHASDVLGATSAESAQGTFTVSSTPVPGATQRASVSSQEDQASVAAGLGLLFTSQAPSISRDGRFTAFESAADNLVPGDTNNQRDVFVRDHAAGTTVRASVGAGGAQGTGLSQGPVISGDGRYTAYSSTSDLAGGSQGYEDVYVYDRLTGGNTLASALMPGSTQGCVLCVTLTGVFAEPAISDTGRFVTFTSALSLLVPGDTNDEWDLFLRDRDTDADGVFDEAGAVATERVSVSSAGAQPNDTSEHSAVSADGRYVVFGSWASNLVPGDTNGKFDVFMRDRATGQTTVLSKNASGTAVGADDATVDISADGRFIAYQSSSAELVANDTNQNADIFVYDRLTGVTTRESVDSQGAEGAALPSTNPAISYDGRYVAFTSNALLVFGDTNGVPDIYVRDRGTGVTTRASVDSCGGQAAGLSSGGAISPDGRYVAFASMAPNLVPGDTNGLDDVFVHDRFADELFGVGAPVKAETPLACLPVGVARSDAAGLEDFYPYRSWSAGPDTAYVNMATGNLVVQGSDLSVPGQGLNLRLTRTYNSQRANHDGPLGRGWTLGVADGEGMLEGLIGAVTALDLGRVAEAVGTEDQFDFYDADGTRHHFAKGGLQGPGWHAPPGVNMSVADYAEGGGLRWYKATRPDGVWYEFHPSGVNYRLTLISDRRGNQLAFAYDGGGRLSTITDPAGRTITMTWSGSYLARAEFRSGASTLATTYSVDTTLQRLSSVTQAAGTADARTISFSYVNGGTGLSEVTDPRGGVTRFAGQSGVVTGVTDRAGKAWGLTYGGPSCLAAGGGPNSAVCLRDPEGNVSVWTSSPLHNLVDLADAGDATEAGQARVNHRQYAWSANRLRKQVDEAGNVTEFEWNELGQPVQVKVTGNGDPELRTDLAYRMIDAGVGVLSDVRAAAGTAEERVQHFDYDAAGTGTLVRAVDPLGNATEFTYYQRGLLKTVRDANSAVTTYGDSALADGGYDASGQPTRITDATGASSTLAYDFLGNDTQVVDRLSKTWTKQYDLRGNQTRVTDPLLHSIHTCFDLNDNPVLTVRPSSPAPSCALDGTDGHSERTDYDARDQVVSTLTASDGQLRKTAYLYYDDGTLREVDEPQSFDPSTGVLTTDSAVIQRVQYLRYPNNRIRGFVDEEYNRTDVAYTPGGQPSLVTQPPSTAGQHWTRYAYNSRGQVVSTLEAGHAGATVRAYNRHGEEISRTPPKGNATTMQYDGAGRPVSTVDANGRVTTRTYDPVGNLLSLTQPTGVGGSITTSYTYTPLGQIATATDPADAAHTVAFEYDANGRQRFRRDKYNGAVERTVEQSWLDDGSLAEQKSSFATGTGGTHRVAFGYDADGNRTSADTYLDGSATPNVSTLTTAFTSAGEPKTWSETVYGPSGAGVTKSTALAHRQDGSLTSRTVDGLSTTYAYDRAAREKASTPWGGLGSFANTYDASGALTRRTMPNGAAVDVAYDQANRIASEVVSRAGSGISAWENVLYDDNDNRRSETVTQLAIDDIARQGTSSLDYDRLDRLTAFKHPFDAAPAAYALDDAGNVVSDEAARYTYGANRLLQQEALVPGLPPVTFGYDHLGNQATQTSGGTTSFTYDAASHPRRVTSPDGSWVEYAYDGLDRLVRRQDSAGGVALFFHDGGGDSLALETDGAGAAQTRYGLDSAGEPVFNEDASLSSTAGRAYMVRDPRGDVTQLVNQSGTVVATYGYDPFGKPKPSVDGARTKANSADWDSRLRFQAAPLDKKTGAYTIGGRLFDPGINRFVGVDQYAAAAADMDLQSDPLTGNRYLYAGANPANLIDDGHEPAPPTRTRGDVYLVGDLLISRLNDQQAEDYLKNYIVRHTGKEPDPHPKRWLGIHKRIPDFFSDGVIYEAKAGKGGTFSKAVRAQALKDVDIVAASQGTVLHAEWHFYPGMSGYLGPSERLREFLLERGIDVYIHYNPEDEKQAKRAKKIFENEYGRRNSVVRSKSCGFLWTSCLIF